ncbi:DUF1987 domain-containing protein [Tateyamaria sp.]|uniref:DUF1987 domain-containing protein n=1 Tax=Tateyamaria sp. TaxID=1929288 RepID=UPI00329E9D89
MEPLKIPATSNTPEVDFDFDQNRFCLKGESHPEDVTAFYQPVMDPLEAHLGNLGDGTCEFVLEFIYFNSSSAKIVMTLMDLIDEAAEAGATVNVKWVYDPEDDNMLELGEEFGEDLEHAKFELVAQESE